MKLLMFEFYLNRSQILEIHKAYELLQYVPPTTVYS